MEPDIIPPETLLNAYAQGVFPMAEEGGLVWVSPKIRGIIPLDDRFHIPRGLKKNSGRSLSRSGLTRLSER